ncbi:MAG: hypothetical protein RL235_1061 [Chlamydiota bacterium]|jgi:hypothetical protein
MRLATLLVLGFIAIGCSRSNDNMTRFHEDGRAKPVVAIAAMIDTTSYEAPWSLSEEFTTSLVRKIGASQQIYVIARDDDPLSDNPFGPDLSWIKQSFPNEEFVVFLELVEHVVLPAKETNLVSPQEVSSNLNMAVRVRVVDLRSATPKVVLQEKIRDSYFIPKTLIPTNYNAIVWGSEEYMKSPMGIAHSQMIDEMAARIIDYVLLAKSR